MKIINIVSNEIEKDIKKLEKKFLGIPDVLIIELEDIKEEEEKFLKENNIFYRIKNSKIEIIILSFRTYLVEYNTTFREGIYFERTETYYNYFEEVFYIEEMTDDEKNLIICKKDMKVEILINHKEEVIEDDRKLFKEYFLDKDYI